MTADEETKRLPVLGTITVSVRGPRAREIAEAIRVDHPAIDIIDKRHADAPDLYAITYSTQYRRAPSP